MLFGRKVNIKNKKKPRIISFFFFFSPYCKRMKGRSVLASYDVFVNIFKFLNETASFFGSSHIAFGKEAVKLVDVDTPDSRLGRSWDVTG